MTVGINTIALKFPEPRHFEVQERFFTTRAIWTEKTLILGK